MRKKQPNDRKRKLRSLAAALAVLLCLGTAQPVMAAAGNRETPQITAAAQAKKKAPKVAAKRAVLKKNTYGDKFYCSFWTAEPKDAIVSMTSSNPKVATLVRKGRVLKGYVKKAGSTVLTARVRRSGKTYTLKQTLKVYDYKPFKSVRIGSGMNYAANLNYDQLAVSEQYGTKGRLQITVNSGWTLKGISYINAKGKATAIKNGKLLNLKEGNSASVKMKVFHKATKTTSTCYLIW